MVYDLECTGPYKGCLVCFIADHWIGCLGERIERRESKDMRNTISPSPAGYLNVSEMENLRQQRSKIILFRSKI